MKILVIGRTGQIGTELCQLLAREHIPYVAPNCDVLDINQPNSLDQVLKYYTPSIIVNTAGYRSSGQAHLEQDLCFKSNRDSVMSLAKTCEKKGIILIHISSWRVFNGENRKPYLETDPTLPLDVLGASFLEGESTIRQHCSKHIILRLSWVISWRGRNRLSIYLNAMRNHQTLPVHAERYGNPTSAADVARVLLAICQQVSCGAQVWGTYHYNSEDMVSERFFSETIQAEAEKNNPKFDWPLSYPAHEINVQSKCYACLDTTLIKNTFGIQKRSWRYNLNYLVAMVQNFPEQSL